MKMTASKMSHFDKTKLRMMRLICDYLVNMCLTLSMQSRSMTNIETDRQKCGSI